MTADHTTTFTTLARCVDQASLAARNGEQGDLATGAYQELWAARRLVDAARLVLTDAGWGAEHERDESLAAVPKHHLVLLEAAVDLITGQRAATPDGFPHGGCEVSANGICNAGFCPCHDGQRPPQPPLLDRAA